MLKLTPMGQCLRCPILGHFWTGQAQSLQITT